MFISIAKERLKNLALAIEKGSEESRIKIKLGNINKNESFPGS